MSNHPVLIQKVNLAPIAVRDVVLKNPPARDDGNSWEKVAVVDEEVSTSAAGAFTRPVLGLM